jgi:hypothetical protein
VIFTLSDLMKSLALLATLLAPPAFAQLGYAWMEYKPEKKIHLANLDEKLKTLSCTDGKDQAEALGHPGTAGYQRKDQIHSEEFRLQFAGERAEIRLKNEYATGSRQFEGYLTIHPPIERQMVFQIWGSGEKDQSTQLILRGYHEDGGTLKAFIAGQKSKVIASHCYERELRINVIHLQEDRGARLLVFVDGKQVAAAPDTFPRIINHDGGNYHKYGCYGSFQPGFIQAGSTWRNARHFQDGSAPAEKP